MTDTVKPVFVPPPGSTPTPGATIAKNVQTDTYWREKAAEARGMREYEEEQANIKAIRNPAAPGEPPVKMTGEISLGKIDFQEQARDARIAAENLRKEAEERSRKLEEENSRLKESLLTTTINNLQTNLGQQITKLQADIAGNKGTSKGIGDQLKEIIDSAALLGYVRPETKTVTPVTASATDAAISLEMLRLQLEDKRTERSFAWQMEKDRRQFNLELKKLDQANRLAIAEAGAKRERDQMFVQLPELLGGAIAKGLKAPVSNPPNPIQRRPMPRQTMRPNPQGEPIETEAPDSSTNQVLDAEMGETGQIECPECQSPITIGPTAAQAVCANCGHIVPINRRGGANVG